MAQITIHLATDAEAVWLMGLAQRLGYGAAMDVSFGPTQQPNLGTQLPNPTPSQQATTRLSRFCRFLQKSSQSSRENQSRNP